MINTKRYKEDHAELLKIIEEIKQNLDSDKLTKNAKICRKLVLDLLNYLNVHLLAEDNMLYPKLLKSSSDSIKKTAQNVLKDTGSVSQDIDIYKRTWTDLFEIQNNTEEFIKQTNKILESLSSRIEKENNELYHLVDELESDSSKS